MDIDIHTHDYAGTCNGSAATHHQRGEYGIRAAVITFTVDGGKVTMFGPGTAFDAFDKIAALFNEAHAPAAPIGDAGVILPETDDIGF